MMLDPTNRNRFVLVNEDNRSAAPEPWRDGIGLRTFLEKVRQQRSMFLRLMIGGAVTGCLLGLAYGLARTPKFSASAELLISNTTLQLSGPDAVVTQIFVENSLIQSAIEMLKSSSVLGRVIDRIGLDNIERSLPKSRNISALAPWRILVSEPAPSEAKRRQTALAQLRANTAVNRVGASQIIAVRGTALTAEDAARLTNEVAASFVQEQNDTNAVITTSAALRERIKVLGPTARIISEAAPPSWKDGFATSVLMALAGIGGGGLAVIGGLALTLFDRRVRSAAQLASVTSAECFGSLPQLRDSRGLASRTSQVSTLRRSVMRRARSAVLERSGRAPRFVGVTSCVRAEGKTTFAASWAGFIAAEGSRVLYVDASCGEAAAPLISRGEGETQGLYQLLRAEAAFGDVVRTEVGPNLDFLPTGIPAGNIDILWCNLVRAVNAISEDGECFYEWVILDLPALADVVDVRAAGQIVDELLVVVEWGRTSEPQLDEALRSLGPLRDRIVGTLISKTPWSALDSEMLQESRAARNASGSKGPL